MNSIVALWGVPRSVSTAFERMMIERGDFYVINEPFSVYYYFSEDQVLNRYHVKPDKVYHFERTLESILSAAQKQPVFFKDMAYYVKQCMNEQFLSNFVNTFIIRDPKFALPSLFKIMPDFTLEETGYEQQYRMFKMICDNTEKIPVIINGDELRSDPEAVIRAYCDVIGICYIPEALTWKPEKPSPLTRWENWYTHAIKSKGFVASEKNGEDAAFKERLVSEAYEYCLPMYQKMSRYCLKPKD